MKSKYPAICSSPEMVTAIANFSRLDWPNDDTLINEDVRNVKLIAMNETASKVWVEDWPGYFWRLREDGQGEVKGNPKSERLPIGWIHLSYKLKAYRNKLIDQSFGKMYHPTHILWAGPWLRFRGIWINIANNT